VQIRPPQRPKDLSTIILSVQPADASKMFGSSHLPAKTYNCCQDHCLVPHRPASPGAISSFKGLTIAADDSENPVRAARTPFVALSQKSTLPPSGPVHENMADRGSFPKNDQSLCPPTPRGSCRPNKNRLRYSRTVKVTCTASNTARVVNLDFPSRTDAQRRTAQRAFVHAQRA
jgi:hypothetical protein